MSIEIEKKKKKKLISIVVPVFNEQECLEELFHRTSAVMKDIAEYDYEIVFFDDGSFDNSRTIIKALCAQDTHCKAVFFARNYGYNTVIFYAVQQAKGDCAVLLHADLQNPPELIPTFIQQWKAGRDVIFGVKNKSKESKFVYFLRTLAYLLFNFVFGMHLIPHATDFELIDKSIIRSLAEIHCADPFLRTILLEKATNPAVEYYTQDKRYAGKTNFNMKKYYELSVSWITASSKVLPRRFLFVGIFLFIVSLTELLFGFLPNISLWTYITISTPLIIRLAFIMFTVFWCFAAVMGEYIIKNSQNCTTQQIISVEERIRY